jgi:fumarate reductase subunit C
MQGELLSNSVIILMKIMTLIGLSLYTVFAFIMLRQGSLMDKVIDESFEPILRILTVIHLIGAVLLLIAAFILL